MPSLNRTFRLLAASSSKLTRANSPAVVASSLFHSTQHLSQFHTASAIQFNSDPNSDSKNPQSQGGVPGTGTDSDPTLNPEKIQKKQHENKEAEEDFEEEEHHRQHPTLGKTPSPYTTKYFQDVLLPEGNQAKIHSWFESMLHMGKDKEVAYAFNSIQSDEIRASLMKLMPSHYAKLLAKTERYQEARQFCESIDMDDQPPSNEQHLKAVYLESLIFLDQQDKAIEMLDTYLKQPSHQKTRQHILLSAVVLALSKKGDGLKANEVRKQYHFPPTIISRLALIRALITQGQYDLAFMHYVFAEPMILKYIESEKFIYDSTTLLDIREKLRNGSADLKERVSQLPPLPTQLASTRGPHHVIS